MCKYLFLFSQLHVSQGCLSMSVLQPCQDAAFPVAAVHCFLTLLCPDAWGCVYMAVIALAAVCVGTMSSNFTFRNFRHLLICREYFGQLYNLKNGRYNGFELASVIWLISFQIH